MKEVPQTFDGISKKFLKMISQFKSPRIDIVFDQYFTPSIKDCESLRSNETTSTVSIGPNQIRHHNFAGCDYTPAFFRKGKLRPFKLLGKSVEYQLACQEIITDDDDELERIIATLEKFICHMYGVPNSSNVNDVCFYLFSKTYQSKELDDNFEKKCRSFDSSSLPPCKAELYQHLLRVRKAESHGLQHLRDVALAVQGTGNAYKRGAAVKSNATTNHDTGCKTNVATHDATLQQPLTTVSPNSNPTIEMLQQKWDSSVNEMTFDSVAHVCRSLHYCRCKCLCPSGGSPSLGCDVLRVFSLTSPLGSLGQN
ncbi:uncharacterized protein TNCV_267471 [Trichonephila clavipes]|nr:uncharacterized protein TNCV_267471 [Trichonephila clavipes]